MTRRSLVVPFLVLALGGCASAGPVRYFQPDIPYGGRAVALARHPSQSRALIAAAETGGLFRTNTGGRLWNHIDELPGFVFRDVAYRPDDPRTVLATAAIDTRTDNSAGIWRSEDGGRTWARPATAAPAASARCKSPAAAYGIAFAPTGGRVYVGTDCGLAVSDDGGASWTHQPLDPSAPADADTLQNKVLAVAATASGRAYALAADGVWYLEPGSSTWTRSSRPGLVNFRESDTNRLAVSPFSDSVAFLALNTDGDGDGAPDRRRAFVTRNGGASWSPLCSAGQPCESTETNRVAFVEAALSVNDEDDAFDVYFGNGVEVYRRTYTGTGTAITADGGWVNLDPRKGTGGHTDNADIVFDLEGRDPVLMAGDGGILRSTDRGASWEMFGNGPAAFAALQINEVTGNIVRNADDLDYQRTDLYFATQDNSIWGSGNGGATWPNELRWEGGALQVRPLSYDRVGARVTGFSCSGCRSFDAAPVLATNRDWRKPVDSAGNSIGLGEPVFLRPVSLLRSGAGNYHLQNSAVRSGVNTFQVTYDQGGSYTEVADIPGELRPGIKVAGPVYQPTVYIPIRRRGGAIGLVRITDLFGADTAKVENADSSGLGSLAVFPTMWVWYSVYGVDPHDPDHLIAPDRSDLTMKVSRDGGKTWTADPALTEAVTDSGRFRFAGTRFGWLPFSQVHAIEFDPRRRGHILVGTEQNGVLRSTDDGASWRRVAGTDRIPNISDFFFDHDGAVIVASYGRGLWKLVFGPEPRIELDRDDLDPDPFPFTPPLEPIRMPSPAGLYVQVRAPTMVGGMARVRPGEALEVIISGARPRDEAGPISLSVGDRVLDQDVQVDAGGRVELRIPVRGLAGQPMRIRVQQGAGAAAEVDQTVVLVVNEDWREEEPGQEPQGRLQP